MLLKAFSFTMKFLSNYRSSQGYVVNYPTGDKSGLIALDSILKSRDFYYKWVEFAILKR